MNHCSSSGYLVAATETLPTDPTDFCVPRLPIVGCSRLRCASCGAIVRTSDGYAFRTREDVSPETLRSLYETSDLTSSSLLQQTQPTFRLYLCRCQRWLETSNHPLQNDDPDWFTDPKVPWACEGHPYIEPPHDVDGVGISSVGDLIDLVTRAFSGFLPPRPHVNDPQWAWPVRLHARFAPPLRKHVEDRALAALGDKSPECIARALAFFRRVQNETLFPRLVAMLEADRERLANLPDTVTSISVDTTIEQSVWRTMAPALAIDDRARALARTNALDGHGSQALYDVLASDDTQWLLEHVEDVARAARSHGNELLSAMTQMPSGSPISKSEDRIKSVLGLS